MDFLRKKVKILQNLEQEAARYREVAAKFKQARNLPSFYKAKQVYNTKLYHIRQVEKQIEAARREHEFQDLQEGDS